jgi:hypothetical protein
MDEAQARELAARLGREHPDRTTHTWLARKVADGSWGVVKVSVPSKGTVTPTVESKPKPPQDDSMPPWESTGGLPPYIFGG